MKSMMRQTSAKSRFFIDIKLLYLFKTQINKHHPDCYQSGSNNANHAHLKIGMEIVEDDTDRFLEACWSIFIY